MELLDWIKGLKISDAKKKELEKLAADPEVAPALKDSVMARAEFSRQMDTLAVEKGKVEKQITDNVAYHQKLTGWQKDADVKYGNQGKELEAAKNRLAQVNSRIATLKTTYAIDDADLKDILEPAAAAAAVVPANPANPNPAVDERYLSRETYSADVNKFRTEFPLIPAVLADLNNKHRRLFGVDMPSQTALVEGAIKAGKTIEDFAEEQYKFDAKERELADKAIEDRINKAREEERLKVQSEMANPVARSVSTAVSPILATPMPKGGEPASRPNPARGLQSALATYGTHGGAMPGEPGAA